MAGLLDYAPLVAGGFAIAEFAPQVLKLRATRDTAGVSWSWGMLTCINNAAWIAYFALSRYWTALGPSVSAVLLTGLLAIMLTVYTPARPGARHVVPIACWAAALAVTGLFAGRAGLGTLLTVAFLLQVAPSLWTAYRTPRPTGVSVATWLLILGELSCWLAFGLHKPDIRLAALGATGVTASLLMLLRKRLS